MKMIHKCPDCGHQSGDHRGAEVAGCSLGWCGCRTSQDKVQETPAVAVPTIPAYDHATGRWARRNAAPEAVA